MADNVKYVLNTVDNTASLDLFVNGSFETSYVFHDFDVTLSERENEAILTLENLKNNLRQINVWIVAIGNNMAITNQNLSLFSCELKKTDDKVMTKFFIDDVKVTDADFSKNNGQIKFKPRVEITMSFREFVFWYGYLERFFEQIQEF